MEVQISKQRKSGVRLTLQKVLMHILHGSIAFFAAATDGMGLFQVEKVPVEIQLLLLQRTITP